MARNDRSESFVDRNRPESRRTHDQSTLYASSRLKSSSSSKSEREIVRHLVPPFEMASVERSLRSNTDISPNSARGLSPARASSPLPGIVRLMRTSPSTIRKSRFPGSPSRNTYSPDRNSWLRQTSATLASSPSSRSLKMATCRSRSITSAMRTGSVGRNGACREARRHRARWQALEAQLASRDMERETLATVPNLISLSRLGLAAAFVLLKGTNARLLVIALAGATDFLDGYLARRGGSASRWGALIDPIADRFFVFTAVCALLFDDVLDTWQYAILISRDFMTAIGFLTARVIPWLRGVRFK